MGKTFKDNKYSQRAPRRTKAEKIRADRALWNKQALDWLEANEAALDGHQAHQEDYTKET